MKIITRYIISSFLKNLLLCLTTLTLLFTLVDFLDRVDIFVEEHANILDVFFYTLLKIPLTIHLMLPLATLISSIFTIGLMARNSEITAMRASGMKVIEITSPLLFCGLLLSITSLLFNETVVPYSTRKQLEIYNFDIRKKNASGRYDKNDIKWRSGNSFFSADSFDSRNNTLKNIRQLKVAPDFTLAEISDFSKADFSYKTKRWLADNKLSTEIHSNDIALKAEKNVDLGISETPNYFYNSEKETAEMGYYELKSFLKKLKSEGISVSAYKAELYSKLSFPFVCFMVILVAIPFSIKSTRSKGITISFLLGISFGFSYYVIHSLCLALGRAELLHHTWAAWGANIITLLMGIILNLGAESPAKN